MLKRVRRHLNPPMVVSVIALFAALGGGYAMAFSGSGTLQKASAHPPNDTFVDLRTLTGFGKLQHRCNTAQNPDIVQLRFINTSSDTVTARYAVLGDTAGSQFGAVSANPEGGATTAVAASSGLQTIRFHLYKASFTNKDQVDMVVTTSASVSSCGPSKVMALNTRE